MRQMLKWLVLITLLSSLAMILADAQGMLQLEWGEYRITMRSSLFIGVLGVSLIVLSWIITLIARAFTWPERRRLAKRVSQHETGLRSLASAATAMTMSDNSAVRLHLKDARRALCDAPIALLMEAQWHEKQGESDKALPLYQLLSGHSETAQLGLRGLLHHAEHQGNYDKALAITEDAIAQFPRDASLLTHKILLLLRHHRSDEAIVLLNSWKLRWKISRRTRQHYLALAQYESAMELTLEDRAELLEAAYKHMPDHSRIPLALIETYLATQNSKVKQLLKRCWKKAPSPLLTTFSLQWLSAQDPEHRARAVRQLIRHTASPLEGHVFTAYDLQQRGRAAEAHTTLEQALQIRESRRALTLMAEVESTLSGADKAQWWFARAAAAPLEEQWVCATCHHTSSEWTLFCPQCRSCDTHTLTLASHAIASVEVVKKL